MHYIEIYEYGHNPYFYYEFHVFKCCDFTNSRQMIAGFIDKDDAIEFAKKMAIKYGIEFKKKLKYERS